MQTSEDTGKLLTKSKLRIPSKYMNIHLTESYVPISLVKILILIMSVAFDTVIPCLEI